MKIILKYILMNLKERKIRTAVMLLSIILSTTLLFVSFSIGASYESAQKKMARGTAGAATISITALGNNNENSWIDINDIPDLPAIKNKVGIIEISALYHKDGYYESFDLLAADLEQLKHINKPRLSNGGEITGFSGYRIILPDRFTSKYNISEGDSITLQIVGKPITFQVAFIAAYDTIFLRHTRGSNGLVPKETLAKLVNSQEGYSKIMIEPNEGITTQELKAELSKKLLSDKYQISNIINETQIVADAQQKSMPFFLISFFSLTMSVFIIYSSYKVITMERIPIIGTFRSIGATEKTVTNIFILESLLYGSLGGILSIPIGFFVSKLMLQGLGQSLAQGIEIPMVISPLYIILSCASAIIVTLLSAYIPIRKASRLPVKDIVLGAVEEKNEAKWTKIIFGMLLMVVSVALPKLATDKMLYMVGGFSLLSLIVAIIIVIPFITSLTASFMEHIYEVVLGNEGKLAARNMKRNRNINQNITLLFISISAIIVISVVGNFLTTYIGDVFHGAELEGFVDATMDQKFIEKVENLEGIEKVLSIHVVNNGIRGNSVAFTRLEATDNLRLYTSMFAFSYDDIQMKNKVISTFEKERAILLSADCMDKTHFSVGDTITLSAGDKAFEYTVVGRIKSRANDVQAVIPSEYIKKDFGVTDYGLLAYTAADPDAIMIQIRDLFGSTSNWSRTVKEFNTDAIKTVGAFLEPMRKMTYFILLLAMVGIINNLLINYIQKRQSMAMYKSVGLSNQQNIKITLVEGFSCGLIGAIIGIVISYMELQTIFAVAGPKIAMVPELSIGTFLMAGVLGISVTLLGSLVPILKGTKMKLIEEIKFE